MILHKYQNLVRNNAECTTTTTNHTNNNAGSSTTTTTTTTTTTKTFINGVEQPELQKKETTKQVNGTHKELKSAPQAPLSNGNIVSNGNHSKMVSTTTRIQEVAHGQKESGNLKVVASGKSDASATKAAAVSHQTVVQADGAIVTSGQSSRMQTVKYAVEASSVQEKIIR